MAYLRSTNKSFYCFWNLSSAAQTLNKVGARLNQKESIAVIWANACRQADFGRPNELHLY